MPATPVSKLARELPTKSFRLKRVSLADGIDTDLGKNQRPIAGQVVQVRQVATEVFFPMKINIEGQKVGKIGFEVFRGRKISIAYQRFRIDALDTIHQFTKKSANFVAAVPADDFRWNFVADQISKHGGMTIA